MKSSHEIRPALVTDASDIAALIYSTSVACCFTPEQPCPDWYEKSVQPSQIACLVKHENMVWLVAMREQTLAGVLAICDKSHVKYFFVHPTFQKLGIGRQLWNFAVRIGVLGNSCTVRSSMFAVPVYERLGFRAVGPPSFFNGLHYQTLVAKYG